MKATVRILAGSALAALLVWVGCASPSSTPLPSAVDYKNAPYVIGVPDLLRVTVWKQPDLHVEAPVRRDGKISVPLLNDVQAAGLTPDELTKVIAFKLSAFVSRPKVTVIVVQPDSQIVTVVGAVAQSGTVPLHRNMSVLEAVALAGGFNPWANKNDVRVIRNVDGERHSYRFDYRAYLADKPGSDIPLRPGDVVVVPE